ncbi:MAG: J domain-containing protein [bacterium]|nr:J domain-containing protein [bacterium]
MPSDHYATLGVSRAASEKEVRAAYRRLARKLHPDVNPGDKASESRFKQVNAAYEVLSDPEKRRKYDLYGDNWQHADELERARQRRTRSYRAGPDIDFGDLGVGGDILGDLFGRRAGRPQRSLDVEQPVDITLEEAATGATRMVLQDGHGAPSRRLEVRIPPGVATGSRIRVAGEGAAADGRKGDLYLVLTVRPHERFERKGDDLHTEVEAPLTLAILGGEIEVPALGRKIALKIPPLTQNGRVFRLAGLGMPRLNAPSVRGDLFARVSVRLPAKLDDHTQHLFEQLKEVGV